MLDEVSDTRGKEAVLIEIVSPDVDAGTVPVAELLAGEKLLHFFGFVMKEARASDFGLGYRNFRTWWSSFAPDSGFVVPPHDLEHAPLRGGLSMRDVRPAWRRWWLTARLGLRYARELVRK